MSLIWLSLFMSVPWFLELMERFWDRKVYFSNKNSMNLCMKIKQKVENDTEKNIFNFSKYVLSDAEK